MKKNSWLFLLLIWFAAHAFAADKILDVSKINQNSVSLTQYFSVLEDTNKNLTFDDVQKDEFANRFKTDLPATESINISFTKSAYWLRLHLKNSSDKTIEQMFEIQYALLEYLDFYHASQIIHTGYAKPFSARPHKSRFFVFPISLAAQTDSVIYLRVETENAMSIPAYLWEPKAFYAHERADYASLMIFLGLIIAMSAFNLLLFITLKELNYLLYVLVIMFITLSNTTQMGFCNEFIWGDFSLLTKTSTSNGLSLGLAAFCLLMRRMLKTKSLIPRLNKVITLLIVINLTEPIILFLNFQSTVKYILFDHLVTTFIVFAILITCALKRQRGAYFFLLFFAPTLSVMMMFLMRALGFLPTIFITVYGSLIATSIESVLLAFVLSDHYKTIEKEKELVQFALVKTLQESEQVLEMRVLERTNALEIAREKEHEQSIEKSNFLAMLTHELKSPLAAIELATKNIQRSQNPAITEMSLKHIQTAASDMSVITQRCLQADKVEQENSIINITTFPIDVLIYDRRIQGQWLNLDEETRLHIDIPPQLFITSDELSCRIIISNLIENALKYSPAKSIINVTVKEEAGVLISVCNEIGKAGKPDADKIFEKYYRSTNAQRLRGTGLGLWLVRGIATQLGGTVNYMEHNDKVEFQLWLPQQKDTSK